MVTALYRRYRPETFGEMIGQSQVTEPLMTALRTNRVNHAYLFSGPRGCGKTTSARILARCLNCAEGPTDTPCGVCPSCVELARDGSGSLDVVEIDAASHNGVDDARDLRERAVYAPARDRYKIFILDEAHMVTPQGFNALLKIVEEPPEHIKFIFATTEPDKVIGTIRSRTHHYPFRLIPPAQLLEYVQALCEIEGITAAPGVLPLVVRAGGGSARDTLSLLDQLIAGSESNHIEYERAVALLGYTHASLLGEVIDALGARDSEGAFGAVDRVIQTGQDPRRFVEDLLERLRDVIIVSATRSAEGAAAVLRGMPSDDILQMQQQAALFGPAELSRTADIVNAALTEMTGATSPRLHLELMIARVLVPSSDDTNRGALARVERLERRVGVDGAGDGMHGAAVLGAGASRGAAGAATGAAGVATGAAGASRGEGGASGAAVSAPAAASTGGSGGAAGSSAEASSSGGQSDGRADAGGVGSSLFVGTGTGSGSSSSDAPSSNSSERTYSIDGRPGSSTTSGEESEPQPAAPSSSAASAEPATATSATAVPASVPVAETVSIQQLKDAWPEILETVGKANRAAWIVVYTGSVRALAGDVLTLTFPSQNDVDNFKQQHSPGQGVSEFLRQAIVDVLGLRVKFIARVDASNTSAERTADPQPGQGATTDRAGNSAASSADAPPVQVAGSSAGRDAPGRLAATPVAGAPAGRPASAGAPAPAAAPARASASHAAGAAPAPGATAPAPGATAPATPRAVPASGPSARASWPVVAIPVSAPEEGDEPVRAGAITVDIPMSEIPEDIPEGDIPDYDSPAEWASADEEVPFASGPSDAQPATTPPVSAAPDRAAPGRAASDRPAPDRASPDRPAPPNRSAAPDRPVPQFGEKQRYGEAVVREILGASFIEERPVAPRPAPNREG
ncbi:DNA polymerase III subunit gamma and tau [Subtercola boreus]|uniref:DNA-directed DNA polymerase n=1 Tax=Subtercola boreus TaxID=120213 RepID=A0A3E0WF81_9MICO|nr:DNA polymerase III subunit gamma and tau [Subtercola boreus]RFA22825.1 hypothetical protein B7R24_02465 [Subtercola boreus]RFA23175.1 hypothetical protein B7R23_02460 [Subtercola boreus]RFA28614.1 hypothetical protein B7R25_02475 [Subtercola boreus]